MNENSPNQTTGVISTPNAGGIDPLTNLSKGSVGHTIILKGTSFALALGYQDNTILHSMADQSKAMLCKIICSCIASPFGSLSRADSFRGLDRLFNLSRMTHRTRRSSGTVPERLTAAAPTLLFPISPSTMMIRLVELRVWMQHGCLCSRRPSHRLVRVADGTTVSTTASSLSLEGLGEVQIPCTKVPTTRVGEVGPSLYRQGRVKLLGPGLLLYCRCSARPLSSVASSRQTTSTDVSFTRQPNDPV